MKHDVVGLWRPHERGTLIVLEPDAPLKEDKAGRSARELYVPPTEWGELKTRSLAAQEREAETLLDMFYEVIDHAAGRLDSGIPIPKTKTPGSSRDAASRAVGLTPIRLGCLRSEAALVRLLALNEQPDGSFDIAAAARCVGFEPALVGHFLRRPPWRWPSSGGGGTGGCRSHARQDGRERGAEGPDEAGRAGRARSGKAR